MAGLCIGWAVLSSACTAIGASIGAAHGRGGERSTPVQGGELHELSTGQEVALGLLTGETVAGNWIGLCAATDTLGRATVLADSVGSRVWMVQRAGLVDVVVQLPHRRNFTIERVRRVPLSQVATINAVHRPAGAAELAKIGFVIDVSIVCIAIALHHSFAVGMQIL